MGQFYGKYRGTVVSNVDPQNMGRLSVTVPDVSNIQTSTWAMPSAALAGSQSGFYAVPPVGSNVWVEFEQGDSDYPIWSGCFWGSSSEVPPAGELRAARSAKHRNPVRRRQHSDAQRRARGLGRDSAAIRLRRFDRHQRHGNHHHQRAGDNPDRWPQRDREQRGAGCDVTGGMQWVDICCRLERR